MIQLISSIGTGTASLAVLIIVGLMVCVYLRQRPGSPLGAAGVLVLPLTQLNWFSDMPTWQAIVTTLVTIGLFLVGMLGKEKWAYSFHISALAASVFLSPGLWLLALIVVSAFDILISVLLTLLIVLLISTYRDKKKSPSSEEETSAMPATS